MKTFQQFSEEIKEHKRVKHSKKEVKRGAEKILKIVAKQRAKHLKKNPNKPFMAEYIHPDYPDGTKPHSIHRAMELKAADMAEKAAKKAFSANMAAQQNNPQP